MSGELFVVATPIGNMNDMVPRAVEVLQSVDMIAAENPRHSRRLLEHFSITTPLTPYHDHNEIQQSAKLISSLEAGQNLALISDAGTPLVSDPGYRLVNMAINRGIRVTPVPGACAAIAALSASGMPSDRFLFEGFPPAKAKARGAFFSALKNATQTLIFYEAPHRILASLEDMAAIFGPEREAVLAREVTKTFETFLTGSLEHLISLVSTDKNQQRGEIVVLIKGNPASASMGETAQMKILAILMKELPLKKAAALTAEITGGNKKTLYQQGISLNLQAENKR